MHRPSLAASAKLDLKGPIVQPMDRSAYGFRAFLPFEPRVHDGAPFDEEGAGGGWPTSFARSDRHGSRLATNAVKLQQIREENLSKITC